MTITRKLLITDVSIRVDLILTGSIPRSEPNVPNVPDLKISRSGSMLALSKLGESRKVANTVDRP